MVKRRVAVVAVLSLGIVGAMIAAFFGVMRYIDEQRVRDANLAFQPLVPLGPRVLSNMAPFSRYANYIVLFWSNSQLCDANASQLICLNELPEENELDLIVETTSLTDAALPHLIALSKLDGLDVTQTAITDEGIAVLQKELPNTRVRQRDKH